MNYFGTLARPTVIKLWLAALRSGEYSQGRKHLKEGGSFCCLGVLCDLASKRGSGKWEALNDKGDPPAFDGAVCFPPSGLREFIFGPVGFEFMYSLASNNDKGVPFSAAADRIEKELL
jgi:hypothetical protein